MSTMQHIGNRLAVFGLAVLFVAPSFLAAADQPQTAGKTSDELLLEIMEIHGQLVTNELFLAQAKAIGAYLEAALQFDEPKKVKAYSTILGIVSQIKNAPTAPAIRTKESPERADAKPSQAEPLDSKIMYEPGSALLEIFNSDSMDEVPDVPTIRTYWQRDLAYRGDFPLPGREAEVGFDARYSRAYPPQPGRRDRSGARNSSGYLARFAFYYHASHSGKYGFTVIHSTLNGCVLRVGGVDVIKAQPGTTGQGTCSLEEGFHRVEFWLAAPAPSGFFGLGYGGAGDAGFADFQVKVMSPDSFDAKPMTKDMMLLKKEQKEKADTHQGQKAKGQPLPYVDY